MNELTFKTIKVDSINDTGVKIVLSEGKDKYGFWKHKKDLSETKAYLQFKSMRVEAGKEYPIAFNAEEKTFTNESGKVINFTDRAIMYFATEQAGAGNVPHVTTDKQPQPDDVMMNIIIGLQERVEALELEVFEKETTVGDMDIEDINAKLNESSVSLDKVPF